MSPARGGSCDSPTSFRTVGVYEVGPGTVVTDNPNTPMIIKPLSSQPAWCLIAQVYPNTTSDGTFQYFVASGFLVSGTLPAGVSSAPSGGPGAPQQPTGPAGLSR